MPTLTIQLHRERAYPVHVGQGLLAQVASLSARAGLSPRRVLLVADSNVPAKHARALAASFTAKGAHVATLTLVASEQHKSLDTLARIWHAASDRRLDRDDCILALTGGCLGDVVGLAASTYRRGIAWVQCPTTLLACVDASVGGKTAINLLPAAGAPLIKNLIGTFHQPALVVSDVACLASLPKALLSDGLAECIKHACLTSNARSPSLWLRTQRLIPLVLRRDAKALTTLIASNVAIKASIASPDPRELAPDAAGGRALLNFGHTFGHVLEGLPLRKGQPPLSHGSAVALGMVAASHAGLAMGLCTPRVVEDVMDMLALAGLPTQLEADVAKRFDLAPLLTPASAASDHSRALPAALSQRMLATDKKVRAGKLRIIVPTGPKPGTCRVVSNPPEHALHAAWQSVLP
jgi:3-dehydroquinate synthetase